MVDGDISVRSSSVSSSSNLSSITCSASGMGTQVKRFFISKLTMTSDSCKSTASILSRKCAEFLMYELDFPLRGVSSFARLYVAEPIEEMMGRSETSGLWIFGSPYSCGG